MIEKEIPIYSPTVTQNVKEDRCTSFSTLYIISTQICDMYFTDQMVHISDLKLV